MGRLTDFDRRAAREGVTDDGRALEEIDSRELAALVQEYERELAVSEAGLRAAAGTVELLAGSIERVVEDVDGLVPARQLELAKLERDELRDELDRERALRVAAEEQARAQLVELAAGGEGEEERRRAACADKSAPPEGGR